MKTKQNNINTKSKNYLVYIHTNKANGKVYVGITSKSIKERWGTNGCRYRGQVAFCRALVKYPNWDKDWEHTIIAQNLTNDEACDLEIELIAKYKSNCCKYQNPSYGYNMTDGGEGRLGCGVGLVGELNPNYGKTGKLNVSSKPVYCVEDGIFFESICLASKYYGISTTQISHRCKNQSTSANIDKHFLYEHDVCQETITKCLLQRRDRKIYCVETGVMFDDARKASEYAHANIRCIRNSCHKLGKLAAETIL